MKFGPFAAALAVLLFTTSVRAQQVPVTPEAELSRAIELLKSRHVNTARVDWAAAEAEARRMAAEATTTAGTYPAIRYLIDQLGERHSSLMEPQTARRTAAGQNLETGAPADIETPVGLRLPGRVGYVVAPGFSGSPAQARAYAAAGRAAVEELDRRRVCGWVVDLRYNGGGNMWPMLNGLAGLLGEPPYGAFVRAGDVRTRWISRDGEVTTEDGAPYLRLGPAAALKSAAAPMAVLVGPRTASSGEFTAMALEGRPRSRFFGQPSAGLVTANSTIRLPDGAFLVLSDAWGEDRTGRRYTERIVPDMLAANSQAGLDAALDWLKSQGCR